MAQTTKKIKDSKLCSLSHSVYYCDYILINHEPLHYIYCREYCLKVVLGSLFTICIIFFFNLMSNILPAATARDSDYSPVDIKLQV